jgi:rubrerythrin
MTDFDKQFSAFEILSIAEKVERNGAAFYHKAAGFFEDTKLRAVLHQLADWESRHEQFFADLKRRVGQEVGKAMTFYPDRFMAGDPRLSDGLAQEALNPDPSREFTGAESKTEILGKALKKEEDAISFFTGLEQWAQDLAAKDEIREIIEEEQRHVRILTESLQQ